ncbi:hypothetical protein KGP65_09685 [Burkholderia multivorans]|uniref:hypothetical protein n=1 Tax=Burkholderia multivorans TaxID=87883 RepID=UPI000A5243DB|nr:hypothetical protein [Burkholderia multivorans]MBU9205213.1 hypothetical protein [Burkholderia multivorans]MCA8386114.1 hypothetical protein [Burkholderia multivorans]MCO8315860.1 hypothetical protein [Burkholderia multivorans]MCO8354197.1 hypothetical protein [Burkholderia multivorans]MCO8386656.1 hypothetical protein [Burkholderia multivorans]
MDQFKHFSDVVAFVANGFTIAASGIALYVFFANRKKISAAVDLLLKHSFQTTLGELNEKIERLNEYNANEPSDVTEIKNILHEISGQIRGNNRLSSAIPNLAQKIDRMANGRKLSEPSKRSLVSELRETLKNIQTSNIGSIAGIEDE